jgi:hypothetical protein
MSSENNISRYRSSTNTEMNFVVRLGRTLALQNGGGKGV